MGPLWTCLTLCPVASFANNVRYVHSTGVLLCDPHSVNFTSIPNGGEQNSFTKHLHELEGRLRVRTELHTSMMLGLRHLRR